MIELEQVTLTLDEVEALRLADLEALYQAQAAQKMKVSRATFARIVEQARRKVAEALIHGKAICMEGGSVVLKGMNTMPKVTEPALPQADRGWGEECVDADSATAPDAVAVAAGKRIPGRFAVQPKRHPSANKRKANK